MIQLTFGAKYDSKDELGIEDILVLRGWRLLRETGDAVRLLCTSRLDCGR